MRELDREDARALEGTEGAAGPFWSPDSERIGFWARSQMWKVSTAGGAPVSLCPALAGSLAVARGAAMARRSCSQMWVDYSIAVTAAGGEAPLRVQVVG